MKDLLKQWNKLSLVKQIIIGLIIGIVLALTVPKYVAGITIFGDLFVGALKAVAPVLVFFLVMSAISQHKTGQKTNMKSILILYLVGTLLASIAAVVASFVFPLKLDLAAGVDSIAPPEGIVEVLKTLLFNVVSNPVSALMNANYIGILTWAILLGIALRHSSEGTKNFISDVAEAVSQVVRWVIKLAPLGVMGLVFNAIGTSGLGALLSYGKLIILLVGVMLVDALIINPIIVYINTKENPYPLVLKCLKDSGITAFFTRSSAANIPVNMRLCEELKLDKDTYSISIPLGATINMGGAAITISILALAAANTLGVSIDIPTAVILCVLSAISACGASGVAGGSLLLIPLACSLFGIPNDIAMQVVGVGFIIGVIQDSCETALNSSTDVLFTATADIAAKKAVETPVVEERPVVELPKEEAVVEEVKQPLLQKVMDKFSTMELPKLDLPTIEELFEDEPSISQEVTKIVEEQENTAFVVEETPGIRMGDTQSMAAVAKALKNNVEMQFADDEDDDILPEPEEAVPARPVNKNIYDTGFIVKGRYDLDAQSEIGLKAGLTEEQKKLFSYFVPVHGMSEQLVEVLHEDKKCKSRYGTSRIGNLLIIGRKGSGKTVLAVDIVKAIQKNRRMKNGKMGIVTADSLNKKNIVEIAEKLHGGAIIIEKASVLNRRTIEDLCDVMEGQTGEMLVVLEDERRPLEAMLEAYPQFAKKFTSRVELPVFINDELVTFGQTYAKENGYKIDEMGILALYSRIDMLQREEKVVTVADVKDILDEAIESAHKASFKKVMHKLLGKSKDDSDRIILKEEDFR